MFNTALAICVSAIMVFSGPFIAFSPLSAPTPPLLSCCAPAEIVPTEPSCCAVLAQTDDCEILTELRAESLRARREHNRAIIEQLTDAFHYALEYDREVVHNLFESNYRDVITDAGRQVRDVTDSFAYYFPHVFGANRDTLASCFSPGYITEIESITIRRDVVCAYNNIIAYGINVSIWTNPYLPEEYRFEEFFNQAKLNAELDIAAADITQECCNAITSDLIIPYAVPRSTRCSCNNGVICQLSITNGCSPASETGDIGSVERIEIHNVFAGNIHVSGSIWRHGNGTIEAYAVEAWGSYLTGFHFQLSELRILGNFTTRVSATGFFNLRRSTGEWLGSRSVVDVQQNTRGPSLCTC